MSATEGAEATPPPADDVRYAVGEKVLVPHTDKFYEAKVLKTEIRDGGVWYYFLHYTGWNKKYDEWVEGPGLVKYSSQRADGGGATGGMSAPNHMGGQPMVKKPRLMVKEKFTILCKKQASDTVAPGGAVQGSSSCLNLDVPPALKKLLLDDHTAVADGGKLVPLPRSPTVTELLQRYVQESHDQRGSSVNEEEVAHGLRSYFDKSLEAVLLYRSERAHAAKALSGGLVASSVFGAEHLCRLFIKLPDLLIAASASEEQVVNVGIMVQDVMLWMSDNIGTLFLPKEKYINAP